ncbi:MAG TPA: acyl-CoA dehydrogenase [Solirubrobacteraceae bacterium]|nr:acyl-CoA dehydrogenase [Solirubrobacteraceae bacterium]
MATAADPGTAEFDPLVLQRLLDGSYVEFRDQTREVLSRPEFAPPIALPTKEYRAKVLEWARQLADEGLTAPGFPVEYGGKGDPGANVAAFETLAFGDLSLLVKFGVQFGLWGGSVHQLGTKRHHDDYLKKIATLELPGAFAMTEAGHGSDVQHLQTTATYDRETHEFVIYTPHDDARKEYIGNAAQDGQMATVFAQLIVDGEEHGVHALVVPLRDGKGRLHPGVRIEDDGEKMGLNGVDNGKIWFDNVRVPRDALLNRYADVDDDGHYQSPIENPNKRFFTMLGTLVQGRVCIGGASISAAKTALTIAVRYGLTRRQFGPPDGEQVPILDYRTHQRRLMPLLARTFALHFAQDELREKFDHVMRQENAPDRERRELESLAAAMKATATWHATHTIQTCRECCGGAGYMAINRFAALKADTDIFTTFEGDNTVLIMLASRALLTDYAHDFGGLNPAEMVTFVAGQAVETVVEKLFARKIVQVIADAVPTPNSEHGNLEDREQQLELFRWRQGHITASVANRFKRGLDEGYDPFEVFRAVQDHAIVAAQAYIDTVLLEAFAGAIDRCEDEGVKAVLNLVCDLFALQNVEADKGFFQEHGRLSSPRTKTVTREVNRLCNEVRQNAGALVDSFGIPDAILGAPIGLKEQ